MGTEPIQVLFVCVENACRSQMAEAFARRDGGGRIVASSAGSRPRGQVDSQAMTVMQEQGLDLRRHSSKGLSQLPQQVWDVVVSMGCGEECAAIPAKQHVAWQIPDPARQPLEVYRQVRDVIEQAVGTLLEQLDDQMRFPVR